MRLTAWILRGPSENRYIRSTYISNHEFHNRILAIRSVWKFQRGSNPQPTFSIYFFFYF